MVDSIDRAAFGRQVGAGAYVEAVEADPRAAGAGLAGADQDGDGRLAGEREVDALFRLLDRADGARDGRVRVTDRRGRATAASTMLDAVRDARLGSGGAAVPDGRAPDIEHAVVVVGMSDTATAEARALRAVTPTLLIGDVADRGDVVRARDGTVFDLASARSVAAFVATLELSPETARRVATVIEAVPRGGRREIAELARAWAPAERGEPIARRLMVSGHGDGDYFSGDDRDFIRTRNLVDLARAMPRAAGRVDAIHLASCQHGYEERMRVLGDAFPNVESIWGYAGFSSTGGAARSQQAAWERATRELPAGGEGLSRGLAGHARRAEAVRVWTRAHGFDGPPTRPMRKIAQDLEESRVEMKRYFWGELDGTDPMSGPLARHYQLLQELTSHVDFGDLPALARAKLLDERDQTLRLRYWPRVLATFARVNASAIEAAYRAVGLEAPALVHMTRAEALSAIAKLEAAALRRAPVPDATRTGLRLLVSGLRDLSPRAIPFSWV